MNKKPKFSIVLIAKDEIGSLKERESFYKAFAALGGDMVLLDTGSTDGTPEYAESIGFKVTRSGGACYREISHHQMLRINNVLKRNEEALIIESGDKVFDFSVARNLAASFAENDWVVMPDCDEALTIDTEKLEAMMGHDVGIIKCWISAGSDQWLTTRCYNRKKLHWKGIVHEGLWGEGVHIEAPRGVLALYHFQKPKEERPLRIKGLALNAFLDPTPRNLHYYGRELLWRNRPKSALDVLQRQIEMNDWPEERAQSHVYRGDALNLLGDTEGAEDEWRKAYYAAPNRRVGLLRIAESVYTRDKHGKESEWAKAVLHAGEAVKIPFKGAYIENMNDYGYRPHQILATALWQIGRKDEAKLNYQEALRLNPFDLKLLSDFHWHYPAPPVSIVIPTLGRPEKLERLLKAIEANCDGYPHEVIVEHDSFEDRQGCPKTLKRAVARAKNDLVMFLGNDCIPEHGFIVHAVKMMADRFPKMDGLVALYDKLHNGNLATHWLASKQLLPWLDGEFFNTEYEHCFCDNELTDRTKLLHRYAYAPLARVVHDNVVVNGGELDDVLKIAYDKDRLERDRATYERRKKLWDLPFTGERVVPDKMIDYQGTLAEHLARYEFAKKHIVGTVADMACGTGYGTNMLGADGYDKSLEAIEYAARNFPSQKFQVRDLENTGIDEMTPEYDTVVSFETIEHLKNPEPFLGFVKKKAKKFIFSIPIENPSQFHPVTYTVEDILRLASVFKKTEWFEQVGMVIKPLVEGSKPTFVIGVSTV